MIWFALMLYLAIGMLIAVVSIDNMQPDDYAYLQTFVFAAAVMVSWGPVLLWALGWALWKTWRKHRRRRSRWR